jgi:hypothetical protein
MISGAYRPSPAPAANASYHRSAGSPAKVINRSIRMPASLAGRSPARQAF